MTNDALGMLGFHERTHELYWDGEKLLIERRLADFERVLALVGVAAALIAAVATSVQAVAAIIWH